MTRIQRERFATQEDYDKVVIILNSEITGLLIEAMVFKGLRSFRGDATSDAFSQTAHGCHASATTSI